MIVHKFGGTSIGSADRIANVADIVVEQQRRTNGTPQGGTVVVVSAMSTVTNQLIAGAWAAADGDDAAYRRTKAGLLEKHLGVVEALLADSPERVDVAGLVEDRLHEVDRLYRSIAVLGEVTPRAWIPLPHSASNCRRTSSPRCCGDEEYAPRRSAHLSCLSQMTSLARPLH